MVRPGTLAVLLCVLGLALASGTGRAATPLTLPPTEAEDDWAATVALVGFELAPPGEGPWVVLIAAVPEWQLLVQDSAGEVHRVSSAPPRTEVEREELLFLASSLLHADEPVKPVKPVVEEPRPAVASRPVRPPPVVAEVAEPVVAEPVVPEPEPEPQPEAAPPSPPATALGAGAFVLQGRGASLRPGLALRLVQDGPGALVLGLELRGVPGAALADQPEGRRVSAAGGGVHLGLRLAEVLRPTLWLGPGVELQSFRDAGGSRGRPLVGTAELRASLEVPLGSSLLLSPGLGAALDLRRVELLDEAGRSRLPPLGLLASLSLSWRSGDHATPRIGDPRALFAAWQGRSPQDPQSSQDPQ